jgi:hypothetical protein
MAVPAIAGASGTPAYQLKNKRESCRQGYVRQVRHVKRHRHGRVARVRELWCIWQGPAATSVQLNTSWGLYLGATFWDVSTAISYDKGAHELPGQSLEYTITDETAGHEVGTFTGQSSLNASCSVVVSVDRQAGTKTLTGQPIAGYPGCSLTPLTLPGPDVVGLTASFAGNQLYAPSTSAPELF